VAYFDSAYIAKFYLDEPESQGVRRLATSLGNVHCLSIGQVEVASVFHRKMREGAFGEAAFREIAAQFADDCSHGLWTWLPVTQALVTATVVAIGRLPRSVFLRSADALHLTCGREHGLTDLYSNDRHMSAAARHFGLRALTIPRGNTGPPAATG
jgi:predicted nucleic acid-binding protein